MNSEEARPKVRIAAAGDVHCDESTRDRTEAAFARLRGEADLLLLAGDLTTHGEPDNAAVLADACRSLDMPIFTVLGNHDWHAGKAEELAAVLADAGVTVLDRGHARCSVAGLDVAVVGTKGFVGGFAGSFLPDFGEPLLRQVYAEAGEEVAALEHGLEAVEGADVRLVLLHYAPTAQTLHGEPPGIFAFLGTDRLAPPIERHRPDLVLHGHAHSGTLEGEIAGVPVFNVSVPVMKRDFWLFELAGADRAEAGEVQLGSA